MLSVNDYAIGSTFIVQKMIFPPVVVSCYVIGLYAESHSFVQNMMYDSHFGDFFLMGPNDTASVPHWWDSAEPLWITAEKKGLRSALYWWDGCQVEIRGRKPTFCRKYKYVGYAWPTVNEDTREALLTALQLLESNEMQLVQIYYEPVDFYGHKYGPNSIERKKAVKDIDDLLDLAQREMANRGLLNKHFDPTSRQIDLPRLRFNSFSPKYGVPLFLVSGKRGLPFHQRRNQAARISVPYNDVIKPAIHLYPIPSICPNNVFFHLLKSKNQARHSSEAPKCAGNRGERYSLPSTAALRSPTQRISDKGSLVEGAQSSEIV
ncbi:Ectonucleotide pyrophosphatase/phosphodiesterase family member 6 [Araneus ventricosus]|uniref:glycerophosphocholine cholinephosphodiesterase n=1 Tax=Araneus ventricosus TaxID=182803 RepID=A0A4Y2DDC4_ARAVE|nr:Ectonucleotide pyrophosphatase/phosphodiesterase family member 6 [Araneus ventricosus]